MPEAGTYYEYVKIKRYWGEGETKIPDSVTEIGKEAFVFCAGHFSIRSGPNSYATRYARRKSIRRRVPRPKDMESGH